MGLAHSRRAAEHHVLVTSEQAQFVQTRHLHPFHARLQREVEILQGLQMRQPRGASCAFQTPVDPQIELCVQQFLDGTRDTQAAVVGSG